MKKLNFIIYFLILTTLTFAQKNKGANIGNVEVRHNGGKVFITYDIVNYSYSEKYNITVLVTKDLGSQLNAVSLTGDIVEVSGGGKKTIIWDQKKDGYVLDEKIAVSLFIATKVKVPVAGHVLKSAIYPGWGDYRIRNKKHHFILRSYWVWRNLASIYMNQQTIKTYDSYKKSFNPDESNKLFNKSVQQQQLSYLFAATACAVWTIDIALLCNKGRKVKKQITKENSEYYYNKSQKTNVFVGNPTHINTKQPYDIALERRNKLFIEEKYQEAKIAYEEAKAHENTDAVQNKLISVNKIIEEEKIKSLTYNAEINKAKELSATKQYTEAKAAYEKALTIKPKEKYPKERIEDLNEILKSIESQKQYNNQMQQGVEAWE